MPNAMIKLLQRGSGWLHASLQPATLLGLVMIATCWVAVVRLTSTDYDKTLEGGIQQSESLVRLFEESTVQTVSAIDRTLLLLRTAFENDPSHFDLRHWSDRTALIGDLTIQISIFGPDGLMRATTTDYKGTLYVGDREHFLVHINSDADNLFVSNPVLGRASGKWSIQLSRRLRGPDDCFDGIIIASLDPDFIQRFYETVDLGSHGSVVLRTMDGVILAARGVTGLTVGREGTTPVLRAALAKSPTGYYWGGGAI
jgi:two-component system, sensor histidine kinase